MFILAAHLFQRRLRTLLRGRATDGRIVGHEQRTDEDSVFHLPVVEFDPKPFYVPLALPGDDITPAQFICFRFAGDRGLYIHPGVWHEGVFTARGKQRFLDKQGAVHARVSVDFAREFNCLLEVDLRGGA